MTLKNITSKITLLAYGKKGEQSACTRGVYQEQRKMS